MSTRSGPAELAAEVGGKARALAGLVRRMIVTRTSTALWQIAGHLLFEGQTETRDAEYFGGIGFHARPAASGNVEAIVAFPAGGQASPMVIAARQEGVRQSIAADLAEDETQVHNSVAVLRIKAGGTIEARAPGGTAVSLATKADLDALAAYVRNQFSAVTGHTHVVSGTATTSIVTVNAPGTAPTVAVPTAAGTSILKGQ